jgi:hypothetical protein
MADCRLSLLSHLSHLSIDTVRCRHAHHARRGTHRLAQSLRNRFVLRRPLLLKNPSSPFPLDENCGRNLRFLCSGGCADFWGIGLHSRWTGREGRTSVPRSSCVHDSWWLERDYAGPGDSPEHQGELALSGRFAWAPLSVELHDVLISLSFTLPLSPQIAQIMGCVSSSLRLTLSRC